MAKGSHQDRGGSRRDATLDTVIVQSGRSAKAEAAVRPRLVDLCGEWLTLIVTLGRAESLPDPVGLRARAMEIKSRLEDSSRQHGFSAADAEAASFALVAFLDETILNSSGPARDQWLAKPLQLELYGQMVGGEEFFDRLDRLRREREERIEALEVYFCCMAFGFSGKFKLSGPERIRSMLAEVERDIAAVRGPSQRPLAPHATRRDAFKEAAQGIPMWISLLVFIPATLLVYLLIMLISRFAAGGAANAIRGFLERSA
jgi:type VI secretion system protein ImpK